MGPNPQPVVVIARIRSAWGYAGLERSSAVTGARATTPSSVSSEYFLAMAASRTVPISTAGSAMPLLCRSSFDRALFHKPNRTGSETPGLLQVAPPHHASFGYPGDG